MYEKICTMTIIVVLCVVLCCSGCTHNNESITEVNVSTTTVDAYSFLLEDSFIYYNFTENETITYYRHYFENERTEKIGVIDNYVFGMGQQVLIDNCLYILITQAESTAAVFEEKKYTNAIYSIDLTSNRLSEIYKGSVYLPGAFLYSMGEYLVIRQTHRSEDNVLTTFVELYNTRTGTFEKQSQKYLLDDNHNIGAYMMCLYADNEYIYALVDERFEDGSNSPKLLKYNDSLELITTLSFDSFSDYIMTSRVGEIAVYDNMVYMRNYSNNAIVGIIEENTIIELMRDNKLAMAIVCSNTDLPVFFLRGEEKLFYYNETEKALLSNELDLRDGYLIGNIMCNKSRLLLTLFSYSSSPEDTKPERIILTNKEFVSNVK